MIGLNRYGASAKGEVVFANLGITADAVVKAATEL
jgi:transketolase